jgi:hypothetical protein
MIPPLIKHHTLNAEQPVRPPITKKSTASKITRPVVRYQKSQQAAGSTNAFELIKNTYADAIEYRTIPVQVRGLALLFGLLTAALAIRGGWLFYSSILDRDGKVATFFYFLFFLIVLLCLCGLMLAVFSVRLELFRPVDEPVIFDRKNRKVYLVARAIAPGLRGLFKSWPLHVHEYDWSLIDAEYHLTISTTGSTVNTWHNLQFLVKSSIRDSRKIGSFYVANPILLTESTVGPFWEHIRRFMEEDGPHLPHGETKTYLEVPKSLWQSMGAVGPFGPNYFYWWKQHPFYSCLLHLFSPIFLPVCFAWGLMNWLSYLTAIEVQWPIEVEAAIGAATQ